MVWRALQVLQFVSLASLFSIHTALGQALAPVQDGVCGSTSTRVTICFPGTPENATCTYSVLEEYAGNDLAPAWTLLPCPQQPIFGSECFNIPGTLYIAYGPCNSNDVNAVSTPQNTMAVTDWLDVIGINSLEVLGGLFVRGYAFQKQYPTDADLIDLLPALHELEPPTTVQLNSVQYSQVTIYGLEVPAMPHVEEILAGLTILNSPDVNFTDPPRFQSLTNVSLGLNIAGCNSLTSLAGLEMLSGGSSLANVEIINNLFLSNITALTHYFKCQGNGSMLLDPEVVIGTIAVHPVPLQKLARGCSFHTPTQVCQFIHSNVCPEGTEYVRNPDGTIQYVTDSSSPPASVATPSTAPSQSIG